MLCISLCPKNLLGFFRISLASEFLKFRNLYKRLYILQNIFQKRNFVSLDDWGNVWMENKEIFNVLFREKPAMMLVALRNTKGEMYASSLAKQVDCTYSHVVKILQEMERDNLINFDKQGRLKLLTLTKKGQDVAEMIDRVRNLL